MEYLSINSASELLVRAENQSNKLNESNSEYQRIVELYYIARYFVALFESREQSLPIQVWNEYRNALDHFVRHLTLTKDISKEDQHQHLQKMEAHIQRAVLDISKFLCLYFDGFYSSIKNKEALSMVSDGELLTDIEKAYTKSRDIFEGAKMLDSNLGEDANANTEVLAGYCDAVFAYKKIEDLYDQNLEKINRAISKYSSTYEKGKNLSIIQQILIGIFIAVVSFVFGKFII